jgi:hypothetical protein
MKNNMDEDENPELMPSSKLSKRGGEKRMFCKHCKQEVRPKMELNWAVFIATLLLFWPATLLYLSWKYSKKEYVCPMCRLPMKAEL